VRSQLVYYPLNLESAIATSYLPLFVHPHFLQVFLVEAYAYFVEKGYRSMRMERLFGDPFLLEFIRERYRLEETHSQLIEVVLNSKKFKNTFEASSNAITLLSKMGFVFSNLNFDDCNISQADLSGAVFYQCSFRGADLERTVLYKAQMVSCMFDNAVMSRINLFCRKYEIEFTAMATSLSADAKKIAFGCGNYLIVINADTGAEIKRIEAHLDVIRLVKYTRDGNSLITVADDKTLRIWDVLTYKSVVFKLPQKGSISYSNETETIASVNKNMLKVWNLKSMANEAELEGHAEAITTVEFSYDGEWILTGSKDTTLRLWTLRGQQKVVYKGHDS
jgi:WD40 repeat protein